MKISDDEADKIKVQRMDSEDFNIHGNFRVMGSKPRIAMRKYMIKYFDNAMGNYGNISTHKRRCTEKSTGNIGWNYNIHALLGRCNGRSKVERIPVYGVQQTSPYEHIG